MQANEGARLKGTWSRLDLQIKPDIYGQGSFRVGPHFTPARPTEPEALPIPLLALFSCQARTAVA
jgi:hypothetical protein